MLNYIKIFLTCITITKGAKINNTANSSLNILDKFRQSDYHLTFEWTERLRYNKRYGYYETCAFKYNRTTTVSNATLFSNIDVGNDIQLMIQVYKFASNEYRIFPIRIAFNFCEAIDKQTMGFDKFKECGNFSCPILKGKVYHYCNWRPSESNFPPLVPSGKYMMEATFMHHSEEMIVTRSYGTISRPIQWE